jgi:hypothetical protein
LNLIFIAQEEEEEEAQKRKRFSLVCLAPGRNETSSSCIHDGVKEEEGIKKTGLLFGCSRLCFGLGSFAACPMPLVVGSSLFSTTHFVQMCAKCQGQGRVLGCCCCLFGSDRGTTTSTSHPLPLSRHFLLWFFGPENSPTEFQNSTQFFVFLYFVFYF